MDSGGGFLKYWLWVLKAFLLTSIIFVFVLQLHGSLGAELPGTQPRSAPLLGHGLFHHGVNGHVSSVVILTQACCYLCLS